MKVLLDTNFLIYMLENKISFDQLFEFLNVNKVFIFLTTLGEVGSVKKKYLKIVKLLIKNGKIEMIKKQGKVDKLIFELVKNEKNEWIICTNDKELSQKIKRFAKVVRVSKKYFRFL